ncbi:MAG: GTPase [Planctomycetota bacterium]|nr:GTPase [Planctomycetota bacterium]
MNRVIPLSAAGYSALSCLRVEGPDIRALVKRLFLPGSPQGWENLSAGEPVFGHWKQHNGEEVVVSILGENIVEIQCHGGTVSQDLLVDSFLEEGCELLDWQNWITETAENSIEAAAIKALTNARTHRVAMILIDQLRGALQDAIEQIVNYLVQPDLVAAKSGLEALISQSKLGTHLESGWRVALIGSPNAGKSSLINAILGFQRSIVLSQPGTTRDLVTASTAIEGWPVELVDTAGLRSGGEPLEEMGMQLALQQASRSDLVLLVTDASSAWTAEQDRWRSEFENVLVVHNKQDLTSDHTGERPEGIPTVAISKAGVEHLCAQIVQRTVGDAPVHGLAVPFTHAQVEGIQSALALLESGEITEAKSILLRLLQADRAASRPQANP